MADYYPLLSRAISALPENNGEARRTVYERARAALLAQLRGADPPLPDAEVTRERLALEEAVRRVETEYAAMAAATLGSSPRMSPPERPEPMLPRVGAPRPPAERPAPVVPTSYDDEETGEPAPPPEPRAPAGMIRSGLTPARGEIRPRPPEPAASPRELRAEADRPSEPPRKGRTVRHPAEEEAPARRGGIGRLILPLIVLLVIGGAGALGYMQRDHIIALIREFRAGTSTTAQTEVPKQQQAAEPSKSTDRITQAPSDAPRRATGNTSGGPAPAGPASAVAQRAVLYEENPGGGQQGLQQFVGTVAWKTETFDPGNGLAPDIGIRAVIEIPDRQIKIELSLRRNQDASLPASHIIEIQFTLPPNFDLGSVANIPGMRAKASEAAQGVPLTGLAVRVTPGYFLIGLSALESERQRNLGLLFTQNWLDLPIVFGNGRRGILAMEKGVPGEQAFRDAFTAWGMQLPPANRQPPAP